MFGSGYNVADEIKQYGEVYDNTVFTEEENPLFVNPTIGDYRIRDDVDFPDIEFEKIGRY